MSDEIQAIATNNYVLHNIDAKKLYVQEPLFTANSGDAVYVGWRPDETVLWSGTASTTNFPLSLSEPMSSFETVKFYWQSFNYNAKNWLVSEKIPVGNDNYYTLFDGIYNTGTSGWFNVGFSFKEENGKLNYLNGAYNNWSNNVVGDASTFLSMFKIVGVNRKENA